MDFSISEEQEMLQDTLRSFVAKECDPLRIHEVFNGDAGWDPDLWKGLCEMGIAGLIIPEAHGGSGLEVLDLALATEILGAAAAPVPLLGHSLAIRAILLAGNQHLQNDLLPKLANGEVVATVAFGEAKGLWQPEVWQCAESEGSLYGHKLFVPHASIADLIVVGTAGGGLAIIDRNADGVSIDPFDGVDRTRPTASLTLEGVPYRALSSDPRTARQVSDTALVLLAADAFGGAWHLLHATADYLSTREQFGTVLAQFQGIKHQLANLVTELEPTRALYWYAAHACDHIPDEAARATAIAKAHITDRAMDIAREAVELHGGIAFTWECDVHLWYRRAMFNRAWMGDPDSHRARYADLAGW